MNKSGDFSGKFAIVGLGMIMGHLPAYTARALETEAARLAIEDAGLKRADIDGAIHCRSGGGTVGRRDWIDTYPRLLGLPTRFYQITNRGGTKAAVAILLATQVLELGLANYVIVGCGMDEWSRSHTGQGERGMRLESKDGVYGSAIGDVQAVSSHIFLAQRHMYEYGTTSQQMGAVAVAERQWACLNPSAQMYGHPITIEDHQNSPMLVWPYHRLDFCLVSDGGMSFIVTTAERAKDLRKPPVYIMGVGTGEAVAKLWWEKKNYTNLPIETAKASAFRLAGISLKDIDVAQLYDSFTGEVLLQMEDYGWCKKGEGGPFIEAGNIAPGGTIPVNTGGGQLSCHYIFDLTQLAEAIVQLRGEGGARQVKDAETCLVSGHGGEFLRPGMCPSHSTIILRR